MKLAGTATGLVIGVAGSLLAQHLGLWGIVWAAGVPVVLLLAALALLIIQVLTAAKRAPTGTEGSLLRRSEWLLLRWQQVLVLTMSLAVILMLLANFHLRWISNGSEVPELRDSAAEEAGSARSYSSPAELPRSLGPAPGIRTLPSPDLLEPPTTDSSSRAGDVPESVAPSPEAMPFDLLGLKVDLATPLSLAAPTEPSSAAPGIRLGQGQESAHRRFLGFDLLKSLFAQLLADVAAVAGLTGAPLTLDLRLDGWLLSSGGVDVKV